MVRSIGGPFAVLVLAGCPGDGVATGGSSETGVGPGTSGAASMSETGALPTSTPTTSGSTDPGEATTDGSSGDGSSESSTGEPASCGPPCDAPWVHDGDLKVDADADPASLRCLVEVTGELQLAEVTGSPPAELANLRRIGGDLEIGAAHEMTSLAGLECVELIGGTLSLVENTKLADISGLAGVKHMHSLRFRGSPEVTDLSLWDGVTGLRWIHLEDMSGVPRLPAPGPDASLYELTIERCDALTDLDALAGVPGDPLGLEVRLEENPKLSSVAGIGDLWSGGAWVVLDTLPALESLAGLEGLGDGGAVYLRRLPLVADVEALAGIEALDVLYLDGMPKLTTLAPLAGLREVNHLTLGSCSEEGGEGLDGLKTLAPLEELEQLGRLTIARNDGLTELPGLSALQFDLAEVEVIDNPELSALQVDAFVGEHGGCAQPPMTCQCSEDLPNP